MARHRPRSPSPAYGSSKRQKHAADYDNRYDRDTHRSQARYADPIEDRGGRSNQESDRDRGRDSPRDRDYEYSRSSSKKYDDRPRDRYHDRYDRDRSRDYDRDENSDRRREAYGADDSDRYTTHRERSKDGDLFPDRNRNDSRDRRASPSGSTGRNARESEQTNEHSHDRFSHSKSLSNGTERRRDTSRPPDAKSNGTANDRVRHGLENFNICI